MTDIGLDRVDAGWTTTAENYLGKVTKGRIVAAVREAKGDEAADGIESMKKDAQAERAEQLIVGTSWLARAYGVVDEIVTCAFATDARVLAVRRDDL